MSGLELFVGSDENNHCMSICLKPKIPYVLTPSLAQEIRAFQNKLVEKYYANPWNKVVYLFWHLHAGRIKWKGLDFMFIHDALKNGNNEAMERYIDDVFTILFLNYVGLDIPLINCSIVNRPVRGISQDFFFVNKINFIKKPRLDNFISANEEKIVPIDIFSYNRTRSFPDRIYAFNKYYEYHFMNLQAMSVLINTLEYEPLNKNKLIETKTIFDVVMEETINTLYEMSSKSLNSIERLSKFQSKS